MNCQDCRRKLMRQADPQNPPVELALHVVSCDRCRAWLERLKQIEANVPRLPLPPSQRKAEVVRFFLKSPTSTESAPVQPAPSYRTDEPANTPSSAGSRAATTYAVPTIPVRPWLRRWTMAAAAAAILIATGIWLGNWAARNFRDEEQPIAKKEDDREKKDFVPKEEKKDAPIKTLAALLLECDMELAETSDPSRRVQALAKLARGLQDESPHLAKSSTAKEMAALARLYERVLTGGVVPRAKAVPMAERRGTLEPIAEQLALSRESMKTLASKVGAEMAPAVEQIADAADSAARKLQVLMDEAS